MKSRQQQIVDDVERDEIGDETVLRNRKRIAISAALNIVGLPMPAPIAIGVVIVAADPPGPWPIENR